MTARPPMYLTPHQGRSCGLCQAQVSETRMVPYAGLTAEGVHVGYQAIHSPCGHHDRLLSVDSRDGLGPISDQSMDAVRSFVGLDDDPRVERLLKTLRDSAEALDESCPTGTCDTAEGMRMAAGIVERTFNPEADQ